jgi:hypothetical protein
MWKIQNELIPYDSSLDEIVIVKDIIISFIISVMDDKKNGDDKSQGKFKYSNTTKDRVAACKAYIESILSC